MYSESSISAFLERKLDSWDFIKEVGKKDLIEQIHELGGNAFKTVPFVHQLASFLLGVHKGSFLYYLFPGSGKAQPIDSKVLTPFGWELLGNLKVNDIIISPDNTATKIIAIHDFARKDIYKITFNDNSCTECCEDHLWKIYNNKTYKRNKKSVFEVISVKELMRRGLKYSCVTNKYRIPMVEAIDFTSTDNKRPVISSINAIAKLLFVDYKSIYKWITKLDIKPVSYINNNKYYNFYDLLQQLLAVKCKRSNYLNSEIKSLSLNKEDYFYKLDPYLLGILLGDGSFRKSITITNNDEEIINSIRSKLPKYCKLVKFDTITYGIKSTNRLIYNQVLAEIKYLGLFNLKSEAKFIPQSYKLTNVEDRIALLQGLLDTDGYIDQTGCISYSASSSQLCKDVCFIIQSLGGTISVTNKVPIFVYKGKKKKGKIHYNISIKLPKGVQPCRITRKINRLKTKRKYFPNRLIKSIDYVGKKDARCITVDSKDGLYITNDFIVTHNSKISLDLFNYWFTNRKVSRALILVPYTITIESWEEQIKEHSNFRYLPLLGTTKQRWELLKNVNEYDLIGLSYPGLTAMIPHSVIKTKYSKEILLDFTELNKLSDYFNCIIYDEIHVVKGYNSIIFSICKHLSSKYKYKYGLTGTPTSRNLEDLWSQFYLIDDGETLGKTISFYRQAFFEKKKNYWGGYDYKINKEKKALLMKIIKNSSIAYKDTEVLDLPEKINIKKHINIAKQQNDFYKKAVDGIIEAKGDITLLENSFIKLRQITSGFVNFVSNEGDSVKIIFDENPKLNALLSILEEIGEEKLVVFNEYTITGDIICSRLEQEKIGYERLYGDTEDKYETMQRFLNEKDCRVYVVNSKSGAMSLNLQKAHYQVYFESPVSPITREQSECRLFRLGQKHRVFIYDFIIKNTIDEKILGFIAEGKDIYKEIFKDYKILI